MEVTFNGEKVPLSAEEEANVKKGFFAIGGFLVIVFIWVLVGLAAFIASLVCFGRSGTTAQHVIGLVVSVFFGPFYWIYFFVAKDYCGKK